MFDELDLRFDEYPERGRHRRGAQNNARQAAQRGGQRSGNGKKKARKRKRRGRTLLAFVLSLLLLGGVGGVAWYGFDRIQDLVLGTPDYAGTGTGEVTVEVAEGESLTEIGNTLYKAGVVKSAKAFIEATEDEPRSTNIEAGVYKLRKQMRASDALAMLLDVKNKVVNGVTISEGRATVDIYKILSESTGIPVEQFVAAAQDPVKLGVDPSWFTRGDGKQVTPSIEGFLFPATYEIRPGATAEEILKQMVDKFVAVATELQFMERVQRDLGGVTPYEALIVASLAQAEAGVPEDIGKIARVAYNRLYKADMPLQFDVTVNYYWQITGQPTKKSGEMSDAELADPNNPYSTHARKGLPPTPIGNPGQLAMEGAMAPPDGAWLFFVAVDQEGHSRFATNDTEHEANKRIACQNGIIAC